MPRAIALNCTLKRSPDESSTDLLLGQVLAALGRQGVAGETIRVVDHDVAPGVTSDEGEGDGWPAIRRRVLDAEILVVGTPIWLGQPSSVCKRVLERLNAMMTEEGEDGRRVAVGRAAGVAVVGNEDGAHHVCAEVFQGLADIGFTIPGAGATYWTDETSTLRDYKDLDETPEMTASSTSRLAAHLAHLAAVLSERPYPVT